DRDAGFDTPYAYAKKAPVIPTVEVDKDFNPFQKESKSPAFQSSFKKQPQPAWESLYVGLEEESSQTPQESFEWESEELTGKLFESEPSQTGKVTFQIQNKYIVTSIKSGLLVIHQHLAHQRILYEELLKNITVHEAVSQQLLFPLTLHFSSSQVGLLQSVREQLEDTGFVFSTLEGDTVAIQGVPSGILESSVEGILQQLISDIEEEVPEAGFCQNDVLAKSLAKSMAIKSGVVLETQAQEHLIHQLFACKEPSVSPDNKLVLITMEASYFDKKFM
ncbi:MAG: DNA mismatch repair protein MutL, partial [Flavobacteriaceae bacterium]